MVIVIDPRLGPSWSAVIERQLSLELGGFMSKIQSLHVRLETQDDVDSSGVSFQRQERKLQYRCSIDAELLAGDKVSIVMMNADPKVCVADTAARLRRAVARKVRRRPFSGKAFPVREM